MIDLTVAQIADIVGGELADISAADAARLHITGTVEFDSRAITSGGLFLALPGARADGHDHAAAAVAAGAVAVLAARPVGVPAVVVRPDAPGDRSASVLEHDRDGSGAAVLAALAKLASAVAARLVEGGLTIVGVTGSSGKTSTKDLLAAVLSPLGDVIAPPGSFNNELGHPWTVLRADRGDRLPGAGDVGASPRQHRRAGGHRAAADRGGAQRRHRPPRRVRLATGHRRHQSRTAAGCSGLRRGGAQRRRQRGGRDGRQDRGAGGPGQPVTSS